MRTISAADPAKVTLLDGKEREFLLTRGGMTRLKKLLGVQTDSELLHLPSESVMVPLLLEAQRSENGDKLTAKNIEDLLPVDIMWSGRTVAAIFGASLPDPRPMEAGKTESA